MILSASELPRGISLEVFYGDDGAIVFQIDTDTNTRHIRVNINDAPVFDQDAEAPSRIDYAALSREITE